MAVNALVLGCMNFGTRTDERTSFALLDAFVEAGGTTLDTADCYAFWLSDSGSGGQSEAVLGRWLAANPGVRDSLVIATKVGPEPVVPGQFGEVVGLHPDVVRRSVAASAERLGIDVIDLYWAHLEDRSVPWTDVVDVFADLVDDGLVRRLGISNHPTWQVERARARALAAGREPFTALQLTTSYVHPRPGTEVPGKDHRFGFVTDETVDYLDAHSEVELWAYSPLIKGSYDRTDRGFPEVYDHPGTTRRLAALAEIADQTGLAPGQVVLSWLIGATPQARPIVGVSSLDQLDAALAAARLDLAPEQRAALDAPR